MIAICYSEQHIETFPKNGSCTRIAVDPALCGSLLTVKTSIPVIDINGFWVSSVTPGPEKMNIPWHFEHKSALHYSFPFVAVFNHAGINRASLATTNLRDDTRFNYELNQQNGTYDICCTIAITATTQPFEIILDCRDLDWQTVLADWRNSLPLPELNYPDAAWDPVFCTWYAVHGEVTRQFVEHNAPLAGELGFTTLIIDDGWCYDDMRRVSPDYYGIWYEFIGDWNVSEKKFPDFKNHVSKIHSLGLKYMLWVAPHLWGFRSKLYQNNPGKTVGTPWDSCDQMDVNQADFAPLVEKLRSLAVDNDLDGLKIDFLDVVPPDPDKPNAGKTAELIADLCCGLKHDNPDVLIEFRQNYSTIGMLPYGTQFRAADVPFNWYWNFGRLAELRLAIGNLAPVHADPAYWAFGESTENVARHMMAMLVGVPMLSMDLTRLTDTEKRIIKYYLDFYNSHRSLINHGNWHIYFNISDIDAAVVENDQERMIIIVAGNRLAELFRPDGKTTYIMNLSTRKLHLPGVRSVDASCQIPAANIIPPAGSGVMKQ